MLLSLLIATAHASALPAVELQWRRGAGILDIVPPAGEHLAPDAPVDGWIAVDGRRLELQSDGLGLMGGLGVAVPGRGVRQVQGELQLSLCEDDSTLCRVVEVAFAGEIDGSRGDEVLWVRPAEPAANPDVQGEPGPTPDEAFAQAQAEGKRVLLDFSAVWCPPCNLLAAEILHDPDEADWLEPFVVVEINADTQASWPWKDRYAVGGYPTVIAAEADGAVVARLVGYPGEDATRTWLAGAAGETEPLDALLARLDDVDPAAAGEVALRLVREDRDDEAAALLERAEDGPATRQARLALGPTEADLLWLAEHDPESLGDWIFHGVSLFEEPSAELTAVMRPALAFAIADADPDAAADLAWIAAKLAPEEDRPALYAMAASALAHSLSGDSALDRGHYTWLATLYEEAGRPDKARQLLTGAVEDWPHEFTFHYALAGLLMRQDDLELALAHALAAEALGYGDMRLRATKRRADVLVEMDRTDEAIAALRATLDAAVRPEEGVEVRTSRYIAWLEDRLAELEGGGG